MTLKPRFWGSTTAFGFGILAMFASFSRPPESFPLLIGGTVAVLGSLVYRSAKRTKLGLVRSKISRQLTEALGIAMIIGIVGLQWDLLRLIAEDPVPNLIMPVWALVAYGIAKTGTPHRGISA